MPPQLLFPLETFDLSRVQMPREEIRRFNPQRHEMEQLDGIFGVDVGRSIALGYKDVRTDEFWVRGHIPGRPIMPGVVMLECAAQLSTVLLKMKMGIGQEKFMGFAGIDNARFRGTVVPGDRLLILSQNLEARARHSVSRAQGVVNGKVVFECDVMGMFV